MSERRFLVIGGGIAGLAAAYELSQREPGWNITLLEASDRLGGKLKTSEFCGIAVDEAADGFLRRVPFAMALCAELGLTDQLVAPATGHAFVYSRGKLRSLPEGLMLGVPSDVVAVARSGILSPLGVARAGLEPFLPRTDPRDSLGGLIEARFGKEVLERLVDPLLGGIFAGDASRMSLRAATPMIADLAGKDRSLLVAARKQKAAAKKNPSPPTGPVFAAHRDGMAAIVEALVAALRKAGVNLRTNTAVAKLTSTRAGVVVDDGDFVADGAVVATPAFTAARLLGDSVAPLTAIPYSSVAMVTMAIPVADLHAAIGGSGVLVPKAEQRAVTALSWSSKKWAHWQIPGHVLLRASVGRDGDEHGFALDDDRLTEAVLADLDRLVGIRTNPTAVRISRWAEALPQYWPGHVERINDVRKRLSGAHPNVELAGAAYSGVGIPACIASGRQAGSAIHSRPV
ncbi:MAG: protoporphyrinogen oxidase [Acidimicrobiia bacterium]